VATPAGRVLAVLGLLGVGAVAGYLLLKRREEVVAPPAPAPAPAPPLVPTAPPPPPPPPVEALGPGEVEAWIMTYELCLGVAERLERGEPVPPEGLSFFAEVCGAQPSSYYRDLLWRLRERKRKLLEERREVLPVPAPELTIGPSPAPAPELAILPAPAEWRPGGWVLP